MKLWTFNVDEPLKGFLVNAKPWSKRAQAYVAYKARVRLLANVAGIPDEIPVDHRATISIAVAWKKKARVDLSNILKGLEDALWVRDRGIGEIHGVKFLHTGIERVSVTVGFEGETHVQGDASNHAV